MQFLQVVQSGIGCSSDITAIIYPPILLQTKMFTSSRHKLPNTRGFAARVCLRVKSAFYHRQQSDFSRHTAFLYFFYNVEHIALATFYHALYVVWTRCIPFFMCAGERGFNIRQFITSFYPHPHVVLCITIFIVGVCCIYVFQQILYWISH